MADTVEHGGLKINQELYDFINSEVMPGTGVDQTSFWDGFATIVHDLTPENRALLAKREDMQSKIDAWHRENRANGMDMDAYKAFLLSLIHI